jgi:anti-sigma regulatory factor (Ser/Thr protein kinase)
MDAVGQTTHTLTRSFPAVTETVPRARRTLVDFARAAGGDEDLVESVRLAVSEALTNVVLHAYEEDGGEVHVTAAIAGDELWVLIGDDGHGLEVGSHQPGLGMGLALIAMVSDDFAVVNRSAGGTELRIRFRLDRPSRGTGRRAQPRGSVASARAPASSRFSTTR